MWTLAPGPSWVAGTIPPTMLTYPHIDPVALQLGPLAIHWYGITYLVAFGLFMFLGTRRLRHEPFASITGPNAWTRKDVEDILFLGVVGVVIGGRLGYCLFYKPGYYLTHPLEIFAVWQGGMAFHGGLLGVIAAMLWFAHSRKRPWLQVADFVAPCVPTGLAAGRVGNFINGELWGRFASPDLPWGMVFAHSGSLQPRHPSQVYQFLLEGLLLFVLLWLYARRERKQGQVAAAFLVGYGSFRFIAEYFREPDSFLGLLSLGMSMGQWLCVPMVAAGVALWVWAPLSPWQWAGFLVAGFLGNHIQIPIVGVGVSRDPADQQQQGSQNNRVGFLNPLRLNRIDVQIIDDRRHDDVDDCGVDHDKCDTECNGDQAQPAPGIRRNAHQMFSDRRAAVRTTGSAALFSPGTARRWVRTQ